jgi:putative ATPase
VKIPIYCPAVVNTGLEDIGLADPQALIRAVAARPYTWVGCLSPVSLAQATIYLSLAPKAIPLQSLFSRLEKVRIRNAQVPTHLQDASRDMGPGHGQGYKYPTTFPAIT